MVRLVPVPSTVGLPSLNHSYDSVLPTAAMLNVASPPSGTTWFTGCCVMAGSSTTNWSGAELSAIEPVW